MDDFWAAFPSFEKFCNKPSEPYALLGLQCAELLDEISECLSASKDPHGEVCALFAEGWRLELAGAAALLCGALSPESSILPARLYRLSGV